MTLNALFSVFNFVICITETIDNRKKEIDKNVKKLEKELSTEDEKIEIKPAKDGKTYLYQGDYIIEITLLKSSNAASLSNDMIKG